MSFFLFNKSVAQDTITVIDKQITHYKNLYKTTKNPKKAYFIQSEILYQDSTFVEEMRNIRNNNIVYSRSYNRGTPIGIWFENFDIEPQPFKINTEEIKYCLVKRIDTSKYRIATSIEIPQAFINDLYNSIVKSVNYPTSAKHNGISGTVYLKSDLNLEGQFENTCISQSVHPILDLATQNAIKRLNYLNNPTGKTFKFTIPVKFELLSTY